MNEMHAPLAKSSLVLDEHQACMLLSPIVILCTFHAHCCKVVTVRILSCVYELEADPEQMLQACNGLPETGVADVGTWKKLMPGSGPSDILGLIGNDETDDDMQASDGKVWLLGEQRWAKIG